MNNFGSKLAEKIGILIEGGTVNVGEIHLDSKMSRQEYHNRKALLKKVRSAWIESILEKSLQEQIPIVLGLENRSSEVQQPCDVGFINSDQSRQLLPLGTTTIDVFDQLGEGSRLLILGEPGSGKTITLLQLARYLITRAEREIECRIPVVLNLSSWAAEKQTIAKWVVEELNRSPYNIPKKIGHQWVKQQELLLLLDGLDEIRDLEKRNACVIALNNFQQEQATEMVVCCRVKDYENLRDRLQFQSALVLQPLTKTQIQVYLDRLQCNLTVLKTLLIEDTVLQELAQSPLLLNIMVLAYQGIEVVDIPVVTIISNRKKQLFDDYINRMFQGSRPKGYLPNLQTKERQFYSRREATRWLIWIARQMVRYSQTIFLIEKMQAYWLNKVEIIFYRIGTGIIGLIIASLLGLFMSIDLHINPRDRIKWSIIKSKRKFKKLQEVWLIFGLMFSFNFALYFGLTSGIVSILGFGIIGILIFSLPFSLIVFLSGFVISSDIEANTYPNQGIRKSGLNAVVSILIGTLSCVVISILVIGILILEAKTLTNYQIIDLLVSRIIIGLGWGIFLSGIIWMFFGGLAVIQHFVLRLILFCSGHAPWNYAKFLDWASDKLFLQKIGGGYIFVHRSLMEHFAKMEDNK